MRGTRTGLNGYISIGAYHLSWSLGFNSTSQTKLPENYSPRRGTCPWKGGWEGCQSPGRTKEGGLRLRGGLRLGECEGNNLEKRFCFTIRMYKQGH